MNDAAKTGSVTWKWIAWFVLMPLPVPFFNLITYFYLVILTPAVLISAYYTDPFFEISRYVQWDMWGISFGAAVVNFFLLQFVISRHELALLEGRKTETIVSLGASSLMALGFVGLYCAMKAAGG